MTRLDRPLLLLRGSIHKIAAAVAASEGSIQKTLTQALAMSRSTFRSHADRLLSHGLVNEVVDGRARRYYPTQRLRQLLEKDAGAPTLNYRDEERRGDAGLDDFDAS